MTKRISKENEFISVRFGGGLNTRSSRDEVGIREAAAGENFDVDIGNFDLRPRKPFELIGIPNGQAIKGFITLRKRSGDVFFAVQAGSEIYSWDGVTFDLIGNTSINSKLRGTIESYWALDDLVIITDLNVKSPVYQYDGINFKIISFADPTGEFRAKYCLVNAERALYANVWNNIDIPHIVVGSQIEEFNIVTTTQRAGEVPGTSEGAFYGDPTVSIGVDSAFFLPVPDIKPINGILEAFGTIPISTEDGKIHQFTGSTAQDFQIVSLYSGSGASGIEPLAFVGNDIIYGREGVIESLLSTDRFGDVESSDPSAFIRDEVAKVKSWDINYDPLEQKVFMWPDTGGKVFVFRKEVQEASPWSVWTTNHPNDFNKTASLLMYDPRTGQKSVFWGDADGNIFKMFGDETLDAGTENISLSRTSKTFTAPADARLYDIEGYIRYKAVSFPATITVTIEYEGLTLKNQVSVIDVEAPTDGGYYSGTIFYSGEGHYGSFFIDRLSQERISVSGQSSQVRIKVESEDKIEVSEIGIKFKASS